MTVYKKPPLQVIKQRLTKEQFVVTQKNSTEKPFKNAFWNHHEAGIYVDIVSGEPLFSSLDKFDSGTGWPSFFNVLEKNNIVEKKDTSLFLGERTEVRSKYGNSHLGHVFLDGPPPTHLRYCINSAALRFVPVEQLKGQGYGKYLPLFKTTLLLEKAVFAGGCFWCMVSPFKNLNGVLEVIAGYAGGQKENPTYDEVASDNTGHLEAVQVTYDKSKISYSQLLETFWKNIDPLDAGGQFCDRGSQYRTAIFFYTAEQKQDAEKSRAALSQTGPFINKPIATEIKEAGRFYPAEEYHQNYYLKNPIRYKLYRRHCGRDQRLKQIWNQ